MLLHQSVVDDERWEWNRGETHAAEIVLPIPDFLRGKLDIGSLNIVQTGRDVFNLHPLGLERVQLDNITLQRKLLRISIDDLNSHLGICRVLELGLDEGRDS